MGPSQESETREPLDLESQDKPAILFELAGMTPLSIDSFTAGTLQDREEVETLLHERFDGEVLLDSADFLKLTENARSTVTSESKPRIRTAKSELNTGVEHLENEDPKPAISHLERAGTILVDLKDRFAAVEYHPEVLNELVERAQEKHDEALREDILDSISYQSILANQHHKTGDEYRKDDEFDDAVAEYEIALEALEGALGRANEYETQRLSDASADLDIGRLPERISTLEEKIQECSSPLRPTSTGEDSRETLDIDGQNVVDQASQLRILEGIFEKVGRVPSRDDIAEMDERLLSTIESDFRTLERAVEQSSIDHLEALIRDVKNVGDQVGATPTRDVFDQHGNHEVGQIISYFGQWSKVLDAAGYSDEGGDNGVGEPTTTTSADESTETETSEGVSISQVDDVDEILTWEDISKNERLDGEILLEIVEVKHDPGPRKSAILIVEDAAGKVFPLNLWEKHPNPADWAVGETYSFENLRGTVWSADGKIKKLLDSTKDISVKRLTDVGEIGGLDSGQLDRGGDDLRVAGESKEEQADDDDGGSSERVEGLMEDLDEMM